MTRLIQIALPALSWLVVLVFMVLNYQSDPFDPTLQGTAQYGHNHEGAIGDAIKSGLVELAVLYLVLRPWSYRHSAGRAALGLLVFLPWTFFSMILSLHAGGVVHLHLLWLLLVSAALFVTCIWSMAARRMADTDPGV